MSEIQEIEIFLEPDGKVRIEVRGVHGANCLKLTKDLEALLGGEILERVLSAEFDIQENTEEEGISETL